MLHPPPHTPIQGCPMVAMEQISRSAELTICSEALAPKMGLEQITANICFNWSNYLLPVANSLKMVWRSTKNALFYGLTGGDMPPTKPTPLVTPEPTPVVTLCLAHGATRGANTSTLFAPRKSRFAPSIFNLDNRTGGELRR